ncbi:DUF167 domain-containing protein [Ruficoccus amylovorans]|uniref:UPF0235 protein H5P28_08215 n=1 Tax=Ruficoccus amylovorans TaxID=1804625 RepID=A0A842HCM8_9BACT|nr:DUF167 domain-containing protein [Ruficoccus amylovorans]MBC2594245.1 DUF167 domain-containing protein [Ruficoccus amylovorans]
MPVKVVPSSSRNAPAGWLGESFKIKVQALPERGKANKAVTTLLAQWLGVSESSIRLVSGDTSPAKVFEITGLTPETIRQRLDQA